MITGEIKAQIDKIWDAFWSGGIANPLEVIEQMTYLMFIKRLDEQQQAADRQAELIGEPPRLSLFTEQQQKLRWSRLKEMGDAQQRFDLFLEQETGVFAYIRNLGAGKGEGVDDKGNPNNSTFAKHMADARFTIPNAGLLTKVIDLLDGIKMDDRDTKGDVYEYMLGKIAAAGQNGQFRTPRHIIKFIVELMDPQPDDTICDPACGTAGFLVAAAEHLQQHHSQNIYKDDASQRRFNHDTFHGFDFDSTMLRVGSMNMLLHGVENPAIENRDSLSESHGHIEDSFSLILANPPFAGSLDHEQCAKNLQQVVKTKKTELLFLALFLRIMKIGGRAAVIVPDGVLFGASKAHKSLRQSLIEEHKLDGIISMPSGVFKPYAGVSTAIVLFNKTGAGGTEHVWFYDMQADGYSLDDKRTPLNQDEHSSNNLPDALSRWQQFKAGDSAELERARTEQSFSVPKAEIAENGYDLSLNRYKEVVYEEVEYEEPAKIVESLRGLESEISEGLSQIEELLS